MKRFSLALFVVLFCSCKKDNDTATTRLNSIEMTDLVNDVLTTEFGYDNQNRVTSIIRKKNNETPIVLATISYSGNEVILRSMVDPDPALSLDKTIRFTLGVSGKPVKRIEYMHRTSIHTPANPYQEFRNDTMLYEYDAAGLLKKTTRSRRDSLFIATDHTIIKQFTAVSNFTNSNGNLMSSDEFITYPYTTTLGGVTSISGGSSEYHQVFGYTKGYANKTDFKNAIILNEFRQSYEHVLDNQYKNMPDQVTVNNTDRDISGLVVFNANGTIYTNRLYNGNGLLSTVTIPSGSAESTNIIYAYE